MFIDILSRVERQQLHATFASLEIYFMICQVLREAFTLANITRKLDYVSAQQTV